MFILATKEGSWKTQFEFLGNMGKQHHEKIDYTIEIKKGPKEESKTFEINRQQIIEAFKSALK